MRWVERFAEKRKKEKCVNKMFNIFFVGCGLWVVGCGWTGPHIFLCFVFLFWRVGFGVVVLVLG